MDSQFAELGSTPSGAAIYDVVGVSGNIRLRQGVKHWFESNTASSHLKKHPCWTVGGDKTIRPVIYGERSLYGGSGVKETFEPVKLALRFRDSSITPISVP